MHSVRGYTHIHMRAPAHATHACTSERTNTRTRVRTGNEISWEGWDAASYVAAIFGDFRGMATANAEG